jgi:hypothetical protein
LRERAEGLARRLRYLCVGELFNIIFQPAMLLWLRHALGQPLGWLTWYAVGLVVILLLQGAVYWQLKLRAIQRAQRVARRDLCPFLLFRLLNWVLLAGLPILALLLAWQTGGVFVSVLDAAATLWFGGLALAEQINYYYFQLMYDNRADLAWLWRHRRLKRPALVRDLVQGGRGARPTADREGTSR